MIDFELWSMIIRSSAIIKIILSILLLMSVTSWTIIFTKLIQLDAVRKKISVDLATFEAASDLRSAIRRLGREPECPCSQIALEGMDELRRLKKLHWLTSEKTEIVLMSLRDTLRKEVDVQVEKSFGSLPFLATCVNVAPFLGLFGTVWGIMHSFYTIGLLKRATLAAVALGLSEALVTTAMGLAVAIPASVAYNFLMRILDQIESKLIDFTTVFVNRVRSELMIHFREHYSVSQAMLGNVETLQEGNGKTVPN
jgi:biopolymer transport protein TolQ